MSQTPQITVYGTPWCGDCKRSKAFLEANKIPYKYIDISQDKVAALTVEKINGGFRSVPTILFPDNTVLVEPSNDKLQETLEQNGLMKSIKSEPL